MKKCYKIFAVFLLCVLFVTFGTVGFSASADYTFEGTEFSDCVLNDGTWFYIPHEGDKKTAKICAYYGDETDLVIPEKIGEYTITEFCFNNPNVGEYVRFPVFENKIEHITIPKTITFFSVDRITSNYPTDTVFDKLYDGETLIMDGQFFDNQLLWNLKSITVAEENPYFSSKDGVLFNKDQSVLIRYPANKTDKSYEIPNTVTTIMDGAFDGAMTMKNLQEITFSENITVFGRWSGGGWKDPNYKKFILANNHIGKEELKNMFYYPGGVGVDEIVVYRNSPAHKYVLDWKNITVIDNPDPSFAEQKTEAEKQTQADLVSPLTGDVTAPLMPLAVLTMLCGFGLILFAKRRTT